MRGIFTSCQAQGRAPTQCEKVSLFSCAVWNTLQVFFSTHNMINHLRMPVRSNWNTYVKSGIRQSPQWTLKVIHEAKWSGNKTANQKGENPAKSSPWQWSHSRFTSAKTPVSQPAPISSSFIPMKSSWCILLQTYSQMEYLQCLSWFQTPCTMYLLVT